MVIRSWAASSVLLLVLVAGCGEPASRDGSAADHASPRDARQVIPPECAETLIDDIAEFGLADEPYVCVLRVRRMEDRIEGRTEYPPEWRLDFVGFDDQRIVGWDCSHTDCFVVRNHVLYRVEGPVWLKARRHLVAVDLRDGGRELWSTEFPVPTPKVVGRFNFDPVYAVPRLRIDHLDGLYLTICGARLDPPVHIQYKVDVASGKLGDACAIPGTQSLEAAGCDPEGPDAPGTSR